jgi:hypothetical protein
MIAEAPESTPCHHIGPILNGDQLPPRSTRRINFRNELPTGDVEIEDTVL